MQAPTASTSGRTCTLNMPTSLRILSCCTAPIWAVPIWPRASVRGARTLRRAQRGVQIGIERALCEKLRLKVKVIVGGIYSQPTSSSSPAPPPTKAVAPAPPAPTRKPQRPSRNAQAPTPKPRAEPSAAVVRVRDQSVRPPRAASAVRAGRNVPVCGYGYGGLAMTTHTSRNGEASLHSSPEYHPNPPRAPRARKDRCGVFVPSC